MLKVDSRKSIQNAAVRVAHDLGAPFKGLTSVDKPTLLDR
jgi:hypothetical protein